jgi:ketosteroid isomerase-like protein
MLRILAVVALLVSAGLPLRAQSPPDALPSVDLPVALDRVLRDYEQAWKAQDAAGLARLFAEDGFVMQRGRPPARGRPAIEAGYRGSGGPLALRALAFALEGRVAYIIGAYSTEVGAPDVGKFVLALARDDAGRWLIVSDIDNGNR